VQDALRRDDELLRIVSSYMPAFLIRAALQLRLVDAIGDAAVTSSQLARATSTHEPSLTRMLRALAAIGLLAEAERGVFHLSPRGH
jgi:DNA-binding IclR family transcriptional regulator